MSVRDQKLWPLSEARWAVAKARAHFGQSDDRNIKLLVWHLAQMFMSLEYADNVRVLRISKDGGGTPAFYMEAKENGCCGSYDEMLNFGDTIYLIGCNYGH